MLLESSLPLPPFLCEQQLGASSAPAHPAKEEKLQPRLQCQSARVRVHTCPPASPRRAGRLGSSGSSASEGRAGLRHLQAECTNSGSKGAARVQGGSRQGGPAALRPGKGAEPSCCGWGHHVAGPGMGWETSAQERPCSPRKSQQELDGHREGWSPQRALSALPWHRIDTRRGTSSAEQVQVGSPVGSVAWSSPAAAGCQGRVAALGDTAEQDPWWQ